MLFLIRYDRPKGKGEVIAQFTSSERSAAVARLRDLEISKPANIEVVLLEADSEKAIHKTHGRYFKTLRELALD